MTAEPLGPNELFAIAADIWSCYLDPDSLVRQPAGYREPGRHEVTAWVSVSGGWQGLVVLACSSATASLAAASLLGTPLAEVTHGDVRDALGELANVLGGNVKSLLAPSCTLSLPGVASVDYRRRWPAAEEICHLAVAWQGEPLSIAVLQSRTDVHRSTTNLSGRAA